MKNWQFFSLQSNLFIIMSFVATVTMVKVAFMVLAVAHMIAVFVTHNE